MADLAQLILWDCDPPDWSRLSFEGLMILRRDDLTAVLMRKSAKALALEKRVSTNGRVIESDEAQLVWQGPQQWLCLTSKSLPIPHHLLRALGQQMWIGDVTDRTLILDIERVASAVLSHGCMLDPTLFGVGCCAMTRFAGIQATLIFAGPERLRLIVDRSHEAYLFAWFSRVLADFHS